MLSQTDIATKVQELGGTHKYDLTPDCTHLLVGDYDTPKYRHVAHERSDIRAMDALWIEELMDLWKGAEAFDPDQLEKKHELLAFETSGVEQTSQGEDGPRGSLLICLTGFGDRRMEIENTIVENGGRYTGDLTKKCTHLIVFKPEGKKFVAAREWGVKTVVLDWLTRSVERGLILDEDKFDPMLAPEEIGVDAWVKKDLRRSSLGKRSRSDGSAPEDGSRKLRKTASMKVNSQSNGLWGDILGRSSTKEEGAETEKDNKVTSKKPLLPAENRGIFADCVFTTDGFPESKKQVLSQTIQALGGSFVSNIQNLLGYTATSDQIKRILVVPQTSQPDTHQPVDEHVSIVTEFYIEKCLHNKKFFRPDEHVIGQPFPLFPIYGFSDLVICTAAFTGVELNHVTRSITQLGAKYEERFHKGTSLLIARSLDAVRKEKKSHAVKWGVPVVSAEWLWDCIRVGYNVPLDDFLLPESSAAYSTAVAKPQRAKSLAQPKPRQTKQPTEAAATSKPSGGKIDTSAFEKTPKKKQPQPIAKEVSLPSFDDFATAKTHAAETLGGPDRPLSELSSAAVNKSPSPPKRSGSVPQPRKPDGADRSTRVSESHSAGSEADNSEDVSKTSAKEQAALSARALEKAQLGSKLTSLISHPQTTVSTSSAPVSRTRKRQLLGRALSNVSSGTNDDSSRPARMLSTTSLDEGMLGGDLAASDSEKEEDAAPSTQLEYCDPAALLAKKKLMEQMTGVKADLGEDKGQSRGDNEVMEGSVIGGLRERVLRKR